MVVAVLLRNVKNYANINFIPICNSKYKYSIFVGNNGVGKSAILEALDVFFNDQEWNPTIDQKKTESFICPIVLIDKESVDPKKKRKYEVVSNYFWSVTAEANPNIEKNTALKNFISYRNELENEYKENYFLILIGKSYDNPKNAFFATFDASIKMEIEKAEIGDANNICNQLLGEITSRYCYVYIPVEESPKELLKLHNVTMQKMLNKDILSEIEKVLNKEIKGISIVSQITSNLDGFISEINKIISGIDKNYSFTSEFSKRKNLTARDLRDKVLEAYFPLRTLKVNKRNVAQLSSGEQRKAVIDIAYAVLAANGLKETEKEIILAIDEPEMSMHVSNCFAQFNRLEELAQEYNKQVIITTHWYGFLPIARDGNMHQICSNANEQSITSFPLYNYTECRRNYPDVIELKSIYDLAVALITYMRIHKDTCWIVCEGSDDKAYLEYMLKSDNDNIKVLPVCGCGNVIKLYYLMYEPLSENNEKKGIKSRALFLIDTDYHRQQMKEPFSLSANNKQIVFLRRIQSEGDSIKLYDPMLSNNYEKTEIEDCLNPAIYFQTIKTLIEEDSDEELKCIVRKFILNENVSISKLRGDDGCIKPVDTNVYEQKKLLISYAEDEKNKNRIAKKYISLCKELGDDHTYSLATEIKKLLFD